MRLTKILCAPQVCERPPQVSAHSGVEGGHSRGSLLPLEGR